MYIYIYIRTSVSRAPRSCCAVSAKNRNDSIATHLSPTP